MEQWWQSLWFCIILSICCCWPVGVILYWTNPVASQTSKIVFTAVFVGLFCIGIIVQIATGAFSGIMEATKGGF